MKKNLPVLIFLCPFLLFSEPIPDGWLTAINSNAALRASNLHANNIVRCVWAGDNPKIPDTIPANVAFQFAISGNHNCVSNVQAVLDATCAVIPDKNRAAIKRCRLLSPTLQWIVRSVKCASTNEADYFKPSIHPAVFSESDFNVTNLCSFARNLTLENVPPAVCLQYVYEEHNRIPLAPAIPGIDYPGVLPETTFSTPFGIGIVLRAPECSRMFRLRAFAFPPSKTEVSFKWIALNGPSQIHNWDELHLKTDGLARVEINHSIVNRRVDVAVFARWGNGPWGAPSILSFYPHPCEKRTYERINWKRYELISIQYMQKPKCVVPYDITAICTPANWTDFYRINENNEITGFSRLTPGSVKDLAFSSQNEIIVETHANGMPRIAQKIRYFLRDGMLNFEEIGEEVRYKLSPFKSRRYK